VKKNLLIYSGHGDIVGGDVKYIVDLLNHFDADKFSISLYTDKDCHFEKLSCQWLNVPLEVNYINTLPYVFKKHFPANILDRLPLTKILNLRIKGHSIARLIDYALRLITFFDLRCQLHNYFIFKRLFKERSDVDIFFFNNGGYPAKYAGIVAMIAAKRAGIKRTVMAFHNMPIARRPLRLFDIAIDWIGHNYIDQIIAVSKALKRDLIKLRKFHHDVIDVAYCGLVDIPVSGGADLNNLRNELKLKGDDFIVIIAGNLNERRKGHEFLLKSLSLVKNANTNFHLLIVGDARPERLDELKSIAQTYDLESNVQFLGQRFDIHNLNSISDIAIIPSLAFEATPYTIKESYRAFRPVITTSIGGCAEAVEQGKTGYVVAPNNEKELSEKILEMMNNPDNRKIMGVNGRKLFLEHFEMTIQQKKVEDIILNY
jgi:glycosyltransferase involved in cell wall biosynthesis